VKPGWGEDYYARFGFTQQIGARRRLALPDEDIMRQVMDLVEVQMPEPQPDGASLESALQLIDERVPRDVAEDCSSEADYEVLNWLMNH